jgi:hypothetical protein
MAIPADLNPYIISITIDIRILFRFEICKRKAIYIYLFHFDK